MNTRVRWEFWSLVLATTLALSHAAPPSRAAPPPEPADARHPVPSWADHERAKARIGESYLAEMRAAKTPEEKAALARRMFDRAATADDDPARQYELASITLNYAATIGDVDVAFAAVDLIARRFQFDPLTARAFAVAQLGKFTTPRESNPVLVRGALSVVNDAVRADRYDVAKEAVAVAVEAAKRVPKDDDLAKRAATRAADVDAIAKAYRESRPAFEQLKRNPLDVDAAAAAGRFLCLAKGDWTAGLKFLVEVDDPAIKAAARLDVAGAPDGPGRARIADAWWDVGERTPHGLARRQIHRRAAEWYNRAADQLTGYSKTRAQQRVASVVQ
ncbi:MAG TPA: hypothetical protein VK986_22190 [Tepidisphaeraceae bacterium]|nr:hypothetical protein [Tepidisphaeraceae bacterium]